MVSRLLSALDARIAKTRDPLRHACLSAERATVLARQGNLDEASAELARIRARYAAQPNAVVTAWVCLGEGMVAFYSSLALSARDKFLRAHALSNAVGNQGLHCLSSAWLAHLHYLNQDFVPMIVNLDVALTNASPDDHASRERSTLVVAQAYHWANRFELARPWYERARWYATSIGDETLLSAWMHNMTWLHVAEARRRLLTHSKLDRAAPQILLGAEAVENFDHYVGTGSLKTLVPLLRAHILSLLERYDEASVLFEVNLSDSLNEGLARIECSILAEAAWCSANAGKKAEACVLASAARSKLLECSQADELAATHGRLAQTFRAMNQDAAAREHEMLAAIEWNKHESAQSALIGLLASAKAVSIERNGWPRV
jgi:hypothetical protein